MSKATRPSSDGEDVQIISCAIIFEIGSVWRVMHIFRAEYIMYSQQNFPYRADMNVFESHISFIDTYPTMVTLNL